MAVARQTVMRNRRGDARARFMKPTHGVVTSCYEIAVQRNGDGEWIAIAREPALPGETLMLETLDRDGAKEVAVCVIESRPVFLQGEIRHCIRLWSDDMASVLFEQQMRRG